MLHDIAPGLWHAQHHFKIAGMPVSSRMTVVRLADGRLWIHSPVPLTDQLRTQIDALGVVAFIVAPSKLHHLFLSGCAAAYPDAQLFGAPGLAKKRPDVAGLRSLGAVGESGWPDDFDQTIMRGIPFGNECIWFHRASRTLIMTDLCQWWVGEMPFAARLYGKLTGVRKQLAVPHTVRLTVKDKAAVAESARQILAWPFDRVIVAHNTIIERDGHAAVTEAFKVFH